jgi:predicted porin
MKKRILALAVLGAITGGSANAQSSVTIYGTVDLAVGKSNGGLANNPSYGMTNSSNSYQMVQGHANRIGFRGNEDLGGGLFAQFQIEHRFNADTGAQAGSVMWQGMSYVQLSSTQFGKVYLGRNYATAFLLAARLDPFGWDGVGQTGSLAWGNYRTPEVSMAAAASNGRSVTNNSVRMSNAVGYISPSFSGFSIHAQGGLSETSGLGRPMAIAANYEAGPLFVGLNAEKVFKGSYQDQGLYQLGASYDFGVTRLMGYYARSSYGALTAANGTTYFTGQALPVGLGGGTLSTANGRNVIHARVYSIAAVTPIGGGAIKAGYTRMNPDGPNNLVQKLGLGYDYFLSKRTKVYIDGGYAKEDLVSKSKLVAIGVRHDF